MKSAFAIAAFWLVGLGSIIRGDETAPPRLTTAPPAAVGLDAARLARIDAVVRQGIERHRLPGAVVAVVRQGKIAFHKAYGSRTLEPTATPMTTDTIFDLASLTKPIATATAIMILLEQGKLRLEDRVTQYLPEFGRNGKERVTIEQLLLHVSGLVADNSVNDYQDGRAQALERICQLKPVVPPGSKFIYSDVGFIVLGELVERISGEPLDVFARTRIFEPLGLRDTGFRPDEAHAARAAPTEQRNGHWMRGEVHDPRAYRLGGVAGHAGLFSTADDLAVYAQMILNQGVYHGTRILSPLTVLKMTTPQTPPENMAVRGLGWDIDTAFASNRGELFPVGSFGHTGFTGTSIWIDPFSDTYVIILTNSVHPGAHGNVIPLRAKIASVVAAAYGRLPKEEELTRRLALTGYYELLYGYRAPRLRNDQVRTGLDELEAEYFKPLQDKHVGLVTNQSGRDPNGQRTIDVLDHAPGVKLIAIFTPEHGLYGTAEGNVASGRDQATGLPVYSLYGATRRPTPEMLNGIDALVYDIQDSGVRFYTFITTLGYVLEAGAQHHIPVYVLDRPDPINGYTVQGPILDRDLLSFVGYFPLPVRYGMTLGELARMFNTENHIGADLHVIEMQGWRRTDWFDETGITWVNPSPNLRNLTEAILYPGLGMIEGANISVGRGTDTPFEVLGAPWI